MKVSEMTYVRTDIDKAVEYVTNAAARLQSAKSGREMAATRAEYIEFQKHVQTMSSLANIRFTLDMSDKFYREEKAYYDENLPRLAAAALRFNRAFLSNPHLKEALDLSEPELAKFYELSIRIMDDKIVADLARENRIVMEYSRLMSETLFHFRGEAMPLSVLRKYFDDPSRRVRREAMEAAGKTLRTISKQLDALYDRLIKIRSRMALKMGFKTYSELGDCRMGRYAYGRKEIHAFREEVKKGVVPVVDKLRRERAAKLGIDKIMLYDYETYFRSGNPEPILNAKQMFTAAQRMYHDLGAETGSFIDLMLAADAFDVFPKQGKWGGGYCTSIDDHGQPFILANFNGSVGDVDVLTHEAGHAFAFYEQFENNVDYELGTGTMSIAEIHSMAMEFFAWPYADKFFGARAADYRYYHLLSSLTFLPYGCQVDEFEETCYDNPDMTPGERDKVWKEMDIYYRPYLNSDGITYFDKGTRWQYQMHIYENPMYYIDYCLSQTVAHQFLLAAQEDYRGAFDKYLGLVKKGGTLPFGKLLTSVGLQDPLQGGVVSATTAAAARLVMKQESGGPTDKEDINALKDKENGNVYI